MADNEKIQVLKMLIEREKKKGLDTISSDNLIAVCDELIKAQGTNLTAVEMEILKKDLQLIIEREKSIIASQIEMRKSVIALGQDAIKSSFLLQGGASVALLAFIGKLADGHKEKIPVFAKCLLWFIIGAALIAGVAIISYMCNRCYLSQWDKAGDRLNYAALCIGAASYVAFIGGLYLTYLAFMCF